MPNDNGAVCGCGVVLDLPKSRNGMTAISTRNFTILIPKANKNNNDDKTEARSALKKPAELEQLTRARGSNGRVNNLSSPSFMNGHTIRPSKNNKKDMRIKSSRRTRSEERPETHYTYIDSGSTIVSSGVRENAIPEAVYCTIDSDYELAPEQQQRQQQHQQQSLIYTSNTNEGVANMRVQVGPQNIRSNQSIYAIPSMTSPPPSYDVAIANSWQSGLPPSYEEYLCNKPVLISGSHTPPPPWSDSSNSTNISTRAGGNFDLQQVSRELLANHPDRCVYLDQEYRRLLGQHLALRKQAAKTQRSRAMSPRSLSESRAQQQRIAMMYEDGAFCMETTAIQSAFENGVAFCSLM